MGLPELPRLTHLAVEPGSGGTTFAIQQARQLLESGGRVIWLSPVSPDRGRFSQMMQSLSPALLARFHMMECGEENAIAIQDATRLISALSPTIVIIDDWAPRSGRVSAITLQSVENLLKTTSDCDCKVLLISALYGDASGKSEWKVRGEDFLLNQGGVTWRLMKRDPHIGRRLLVTPEEEIQLSLGESGFYD